MEDPNVTAWENQWYGSGGADGIMIAAVLNPELRKYEGMTLAQIGSAMGKDARDAVMDLVIADKGETTVITAIMNEDDVRTALRNPLVGVGTDYSAQAEDGKLSESKSHPRAWGSFPRILGKYVRDEHLMSLEEAIRKMTSANAAKVRQYDRGLLRPGMAADVTVFNAATIIDNATYEKPHQYASGVEYVIVNGKMVLEHGRHSGARPGAILLGPGKKL